MTEADEDRFLCGRRSFSSGLARRSVLGWSSTGFARQSGVVTELWAHALTWAEADPLRHPFELDEDAAEKLAGLVAPLLPDADAAEEKRWCSLDPVTEFLVDRYGRWACGWNWSVGEGDIDGGVVGNFGPDHQNDTLADWLRIRTEITWPHWSGEPSVAEPPALDGFRDFFTGTRGGRDAEGTARVLTALDRALADAEQGVQLTFVLMANWQRTVLQRNAVAFRTMPVFAKGGRERYGLAPDAHARFEHCLVESSRPNLPLPSRAARTYLDVLFFHPFEDGNARAAMLALTFVLAREGVLLDQVHPLQVTRWADDAEGAADLAVLLGILITAAGRRLSHGRQS